MHRKFGLMAFVFLLAAGLGLPAWAQGAPAAPSALSIPEARLIQPEGLVRMLKATDKEKPVILQVGSRVMFGQAHIPGSEYAGPGSQTAGIQSLEDKVSGLPKDRHIVLYCGCCPWEKCPNIRPAFAALREMGFTHVKAMVIPENLKTDWIDKGYPTDKRAAE